jgi:hypothetical protein
MTPVTAAKTRARVAAGYVGTFAAGVGVAAIPLLSALKQLADNRDVIITVAEMVNRVGWPAFIAVVAVVWLHLERRAWRIERQQMLEDHARAMEQQMRHHRAELETIVGEQQDVLRQIASTLHAVHTLVQELSGPIPTIRERVPTGQVPVIRDRRPK